MVFHTINEPGNCHLWRVRQRPNAHASHQKIPGPMAVGDPHGKVRAGYMVEIREEVEVFKGSDDRDQTHHSSGLPGVVMD